MVGEGGVRRGGEELAMTRMKETSRKKKPQTDKTHERARK